MLVVRLAIVLANVVAQGKREMGLTSGVKVGCNCGKLLQLLTVKGLIILTFKLPTSQIAVIAK